MGIALTNSLLLRIGSALLLMPVVLGALIWGGIPFLIMITAALIISAMEWVKMAKLAPSPFMNAFSGIAYILFCMACFSYLRVVEDHGAGLALSLILSIWASDSGAYFSGKAIGGPKMAPSISPNKTWAGLIGGVICSTATLILYALYVGPWISSFGIDATLPPELNYTQLAILGVLVTLSGQAGDLLISKEKRMVGVKDTGNLIPGHGGLLDRIDALLLAAIVFLAALKVFGI